MGNQPDINDETALVCFNTFDTDGDLAININEFTSLCTNLIRNEMGIPYKVDSQRISDMFMIFNVSGDGSMSKQEFVFLWNGWIKKIVKPKSALIIVDVQNDFISGSLSISNCPAGHNGEHVVDPINYLLDTSPFTMVCYSFDWHPTDHVSFTDNAHLRKIDRESKVQDPSRCKTYDIVVFEAHDDIPKMEQSMWPRHCVQDSWGSELHKDLKVHPKAHNVYKGSNPDVDSYSAFFDNMKLSKTCLDDIIRKEDVTDLYICGIATDVCVASTAFHAQELGYRTILVEDASRGIKEPDIQAAFTKLREAHGCVVQSKEVKAMVQGRDRRPELVYKLAVECRNTIVYPLKNKNSKYNKVPAPPV